MKLVLGDFQNIGHLKVLNDNKLILNDSGVHSCSIWDQFGIIQNLQMSPIPKTSQDQFLGLDFSYNKTTLEIPALKPLGYQPLLCILWSKQASKTNKHFSVTFYNTQFSSWFYFALFWNNFGALFFALILVVLTPLNFIFWLWSYVLCSSQLFWHTN